MFDDLHDPDPPNPALDALASVTRRAQVLRRRRALTVGGSGLLAAAVIVGAVVVPRLGDDDRHITTIDDTTVPVSPSTAPPTTATTPTTSATTDTTATTDVGSVPTAPTAADCTSVARPPVYLVDGTVPGQATSTRNDDGSTSVRWGTDDATHVTQILGTDRALDDVSAGPNWFVTGGFAVAVIPVGDPPTSEIGVQIEDIAERCTRLYSIGPGLELDRAVAFANQWAQYLDVDRRLTTGETTSEGDGDAACTYVAGEVLGCVDVTQGDQRPIVGGRLDRPASTVAVLQLLVAKGADAVPLSTMARRIPLVANPDLELIVDLVEPGLSCGVVSIDGASMRWSIGGGRVSGCADTPPPVARPPLPFAAIDGNGDAVLIESLNGTSTVLAEGADPDDPPPAEGDPSFIDGVAVSPDGQLAIVGTCCEPIAGSLSRVDLTTGTSEFASFGHLPSFAASGNLVAETLGTIRVSDAAGNQAAVLHEVDPSDGTIVDLAVVPGSPFDLVVAIVAGPGGTSLWRGYVGGGDIQLSTTISSATWTDAPRYSLAGWQGDVLLVLDLQLGVLMHFDVETLNVVAGDQSPLGWTSAWIQDDDVKYIDAQRRLFVNDVEVPGEFVWVR